MKPSSASSRSGDGARKARAFDSNHGSAWNMPSRYFEAALRLAIIAGLAIAAVVAPAAAQDAAPAVAPGAATEPVTSPCFGVASTSPAFDMVRVADYVWS